MDLRSALLSADDLPRVKVECEGWPAVWVRALSARELIAFEKAGEDRAPDERAAALLLLCLEDESGGKALSPGDEAALLDKSSRNIHTVYRVAQRLNAAADVEGEVKEAEKNSGPTPGS